MENGQCEDTEEETEEENKNLISSSKASDLTLIQQDVAQSVSPTDKYHIIYIMFVLVALGLLVPWNSYILAIDYFRFLYPTQHVENVIPYTNLVVTLMAAMATVALVNVFPRYARIGFGYITYSLVLLFIPLLDIGIHNCTISTDVGFGLTVCGVAVLALGGGVQQSSYYGLAGMLPPRFTQALMLGESFAGLVVSIVRILTKVSASSEREGAIAFFTIGLVYILFCAGCLVFIARSKFVRYHISQACSSTAGNDVNKGQPANSKSEDSEIGTLTEDNTFQQNDGLNEYGDLKTWRESQYTFKSKIRDAISLRFQIVKKVWRIAISTFLMLFVTLLLFPGITSDIQNCDITNWPPVILATVFNLFDAVSRVVAIYPYRWNSNILILISCSRFILVPLLVLCVSPSPTNPIFPDPLWIGIILVAVLGTSNGYFATVCMVQGPMAVPPHKREIAGNIMVFAILSGLSAGAILATGLTPLTELEPGILCTNVTAEFLCSQRHHHNSSIML